MRLRLRLVGMLLALPAPFATAQITPDGAPPLVGPDYDIPAALGRLHGPNLFHRFSEFSLQRGERATFQGPNSVERIISQVSGGDVSYIDGQLASAIPGADLYLINPAGILFGPEATLAVDGDFIATTADQVEFSDGSRWALTSPDAAPLTTAPIATFGFLGPDPQGITLQGSRLAAAGGHDIALFGADITLAQAQLAATAGKLTLTAQEG